jgi:hypothetical protein
MTEFRHVRIGRWDLLASVMEMGGDALVEDVPGPACGFSGVVERDLFVQAVAWLEKQTKLPGSSDSIVFDSRIGGFRNPTSYLFIREFQCVACRLVMVYFETRSARLIVQGGSRPPGPLGVYLSCPLCFPRALDDVALAEAIDAARLQPGKFPKAEAACMVTSDAAMLRGVVLRR